MDTSTLPTSTSDTVSVYVGEESPGGAVIFTGPDGVGDHRMTHRMTAEDQLFVGHTTASPEATGDVRYLIRAPEVGIALMTKRGKETQRVGANRT